MGLKLKDGIEFLGSSKQGEMQENLRRQDAEVEKSIAIVKETLRKLDEQPYFRYQRKQQPWPIDHEFE